MWKIRMKQKYFWVADIVSYLFICSKNIAKAIGYDIQVYTEQLTDGLNAILGFLVLTGVIQDPTTKGIGDSHQALEYEEPRRKY
ncbi:phage holin [Staphylococcus aureus]|nr:phage holin [Staphylococcus aureus]